MLTSGDIFGESNASKFDALIFDVRLPRNNLLLNKMVTSGMQ